MALGNHKTVISDVVWDHRRCEKTARFPTSKCFFEVLISTFFRFRPPSAMSTSTTLKSSRASAGRVLRPLDSQAPAFARRSVSPPAPAPADSDHTSVSESVSFETLLNELVPIQSVRDQLLAAHLKSKPARKSVATDKTPEGFSNIRSLIMSSFGMIKPIIHADILELFYKSAGGISTDGPMKIATPVLKTFASNDVVASFWKGVSAEYTERGIKRGEAKPFCAEHLTAFLASLVIVFGRGSKLILDGVSLDKLSNSSLSDLITRFSDFQVEPPTPVTCCAETKLKTQCKRTGTVVVDGRSYCTQHSKSLPTPIKVAA